MKIIRSIIKNKFIYLFSLLSLCALVCVFASAKTGNKNAEVQNASNTSDVETRQVPTQANYKPEEGYVPDEETAIAIAVAVWNPIYGKKQIESEKPYHASLKNGVWTVTGSLPEGSDGGTAIAEISKDNGRILRVIHEQ
jgi:hypothetical protein